MKKGRMHELGLAQAALKGGDLARAGALFETVVGHQPQRHEAWCGLAEIALRLGERETALPFLAQAASLAPTSVSCLKNLGELFYQAGRPEEAILWLEKALACKPQDQEIACALSGAYVAAGKWGKAKRALDQVVRGKNVLAAHYCLRGMASQHQGELDAALADFIQATRLDARYGDAWLALADIYRIREDLAQAAECAAQALRFGAPPLTVLSVSGDIELARGNAQAAAACFQQVVNLDAGLPHAWAKLGVALAQAGDAPAAIDAMQKAHETGVTEDWIFEHLGLLFTTRGQLETARENLEMAVERSPGNLNAWNTLIVVYTKLGLSDKARRAAQTILAIDPSHINALLNLGSWFADQARSEEALDYYRQALAINPASAIAYTNSLWVLVHSSESSAANVLALAREFDRNLCRNRRRPRTFAERDKTADRRLRIGWLTSDFRTHPVAAFVLPFLDHLDREKVEIFTYYNHAAADDVTRRCRAASDVWREVLALGDDALADLIEEDAIDILVDLNGNTEGNRLLAVARKPAPIIVTWLGFPGTSGMSAVDYILTPPDPVLEAGGWCSETPWPLTDCYGVRGGIPDVPILPGLPCERTGQPFTFGCLNNFRKASQKTLDAWCGILRRLPDTRLVVVARGGADGALIEYIRQQFSRRGVTPERVDIRGILPQQDYLNAYNAVDLGLDPFPFNGGTTGYDSIWMGVPFVTWPGDMLVSRMGKAILENVGLHELVAESPQAYVDKAVQLAGDRQRLKGLRQDLRQRMAASPLMDAPRFAGDLASAFRGMWRAWCAQRV